MRRLWIVVLLTASVSISGYAQRGGHGGGFSGGHGFGGGSHIGGGFSGGFRSAPTWSSSPRSFNAAPQYRWNGAGVARGGWRSPVYDGRRGYRPVYPNSRYRRPYYPYFYSNSTYLAPGLLNSYWDSDYGYYGDDSSTVAAQQPQSQGEEAYEQQPSPDYGPYQGQDVPPPPPGPVEPVPLAETTLIFKDGHSQQVHNYAMTQTILYVLDDASSGRRTEIPLDKIDLEATQRTNRDAGIEFNVPGAGN
jgi:hypothetical protein